MYPSELPITNTLESDVIANDVIIALCFLETHNFYKVFIFHIIILLSSPPLINSPPFVGCKHHTSPSLYNVRI